MGELLIEDRDGGADKERKRGVRGGRTDKRRECDQKERGIEGRIEREGGREQGVRQG